MEVVPILILLVLNIALPTLDIVTDINLVIKLYSGFHYCVNNYNECRKDPEVYCSNSENNQNICHFDRWQNLYCKDVRYDYNKCGKDPEDYCSNDENDQAVCRFSSHYKMATSMLTPFLLNYIVCFITFLRKEKNKKFTFIFALLNHYPQFGKNNH